MATPLNLNLTRKQGPSVWDEPRPQASTWRTYGMAAGAMVAAFALGRRRVNRPWAIGLALGVAGAALFADRLSSMLTSCAERLQIRSGARNDLVDRATEDSFPASDPTPYL